jgi:uncharacterized repeat protein (TIGR01451 family)
VPGRQGRDETGSIESTSIQEKNMNKRCVLLSTLLLAMTMLPAAALAKPQVTLSVTAEKEVTSVTNGQKVTKLVAVKKISPNEVIVYTVHYANKGDETATNAVIDDPIPKGTVYLPDSAQTDVGEPVFSIDHGKTYNKGTLLSYETKLPNGKVERHLASSDEYTNIRWTIKEIPAGAAGKLKFKVKVK